MSPGHINSVVRTWSAAGNKRTRRRGLRALKRDIEAGLEFFWKNRGGMPKQGGAFSR